MPQALVFRPPEVLAFEHQFFATHPGAVFQLSENDAVPVFSFGLGLQRMVLPLDGIKRELDLHECSADAVMLNVVADALRFVDSLKIGDPVPTEVTTGDASWSPRAVHQEVARRRLATHLVAWNKGHDLRVDDAAAFERFARAHVTDDAVGFALLRIGVDLGHGADGRAAMSRTLDEAVGEFAYIEALRERFGAVRGIDERLKRLRRDFAGHTTVREDVEPLVRLISTPLEALGTCFAEIDGCLTDITRLFGEFQTLRKRIRAVRNDAHAQLKPWDPIAAQWRRLPSRVMDAYLVTPLLRDLYRFLAPRYMPVDEWPLMLSHQRALDENRTYGAVVTWFEDGSKDS